MEWTVILLLALGAFLVGYRLWVRLKAKILCLPVLENLRYRIRSALRVASAHELEAIQEKLLRLEEQIPARQAHLSPVKEFSPQREKYPQIIPSPVVPFDPSVSCTSKMEELVTRSRSIVWSDLRFTLSDSIWLHVGVTPGEDLDDSQVQSMVQGPFCRGCLKRLVGRNRVLADEVPAQCHHCGLSWRNLGSHRLSIMLLDLKRQVYDNLDRKLRTSPKLPC
jgi:hypothetical protein